MITALVSGPAAEPYTVAQAKALIRTTISSLDHDALISQIITAARMQVEDDTGRRIGSQAWLHKQAYWPHENYITLLDCPLISVQSVTYTTALATTTLDPALYAAIPRPNTYGTVQLHPGQSWPTATLIQPGITIAYTCGHATIPAQLKEAIGSLIAYWYDNPEAAIASTTYKAEVGVLPLRYQTLIAPFKLWRR
jgi:uncharacterized phiE125 gp8 family phage protein